MSLIYPFIIGLIVGSFLNVLIDRLPKDKSILGRSHCDSCKKTLSWKDLIPIVSFIYLRGKCRYCKAKLSLYYPTTELLTGILFVATIYYLPFTIYHFFIVASLIVIFFADLKYGVIPDKIVFPAIVVSLIWIATSNQQLAISYFLSAIGAFLFFLLIYFITRGRGMGFGDVKLSFLLGLVLGFPGIFFALYIAFLTGGLYGIILILWKKKKLTSQVPFGPFLILGTIISFFLKDQIILQIVGLQ